MLKIRLVILSAAKNLLFTMVAINVVLSMAKSRFFVVLIMTMETRC